MIYLILILSAMAVIAAVNILAGAAAWPTVGATVLLTAAVIAVDGVFAFLLRRLPESLFRFDRRFFAVGRRESALYRALGVKRLARIVPDLGCFTSFPKQHLQDPGKAEYTARYLLEAAYGIVIHLVNIPTGFLILPILPRYALTVALPVACVNLVLSLLPAMLLRANFPALARLHRRNLKKSLTL